MKVNRVEQTIIRKSHPMWKTIDEMCYHTKNLYNYVNYIIKKELDDYEYKIMIQKLSGKKWSNALSDLTTKRFNRIKNVMHHASKYVVNYCLENDIDTVICGLNTGWKQRMKIGKRNNQNMQFIPFNIFILQLEYKCQEKGINFITTDEAYTSGTSFLDNEEAIKANYNKKRRIKRGLFKSNNGTLINADVNGSLQIMKKVFPNAMDGIVGRLIPSRVNVVCC